MEIESTPEETKGHVERIAMGILKDSAEIDTIVVVIRKKSGSVRTAWNTTKDEIEVLGLLAIATGMAGHEFEKAHTPNDLLGGE